jgi:hypothetical protein
MPFRPKQNNTLPKTVPVHGREKNVPGLHYPVTAGSGVIDKVPATHCFVSHPAPP